MNRLVRHKLLIASLLLGALAVYAVVLFTTSRGTASVIGTIYIAIVVTVSLGFDYIDYRQRRQQRERSIR